MKINVDFKVKSFYYWSVYYMILNDLLMKVDAKSAAFLKWSTTNF